MLTLESLKNMDPDEIRAIPDGKIPNYSEETLKENGFSQEQIKVILENKNLKYPPMDESRSIGD